MMVRQSLQQNSAFSSLTHTGILSAAVRLLNGSATLDQQLFPAWNNDLHLQRNVGTSRFQLLGKRESST